MAPHKVLARWGIVPLKIESITTGIFNRTYKIHRKEGVFLILQKLHPLISNNGSTENYFAITEYLRKKGLPMQTVLRAKNGKFLVNDGKYRWRLMRALPGRVYTNTNSLSLVREAGRCLGKTHAVLKNFRGKLAPTLPMFQYGVVLKKLRHFAPKLLKDKNPAAREATQFLLEYLPQNFLPPSLPKRIIHTDPKISNFIFDGRGKAIALIDWDTAQKLSPLYDLGDALRSFCGNEEDDPDNQFSRNKFNAFLSGYFAGSGRYLSILEKNFIPQATALVILGLAARFLNDYEESFYFGWDSKRYNSRKKHNLARALGQIALYKSFKKSDKIMRWYFNKHRCKKERS